MKHCKANAHKLAMFVARQIWKHFNVWSWFSFLPVIKITYLYFVVFSTIVKQTLPWQPSSPLTAKWLPLSHLIFLRMKTIAYLVWYRGARFLKQAQKSLNQREIKCLEPQEQDSQDLHCSNVPVLEHYYSTGTLYCSACACIDTIHTCCNIEITA